MRPDLPGVRNNFVYTPGADINTNPWNKFSIKLDHNLSSKDRIGFLFHWGEVLVIPPGGGPAGGLPVPLNNFRDEDSKTYVYRLNWDRVITPALLNRVTGNATVRNPHERGPWFLNENISVARTFGIQKTRLEFRFEAFNLLNRTIWGNPDSTITSANFGRITSLANAPRQVQLGLRLEF